MANFAYGSGGNSINFGQGLDAITSLMQGFNGSPQQMNANRQFGISEGHLSIDQQKQAFTQGNAIALGNRFTEGLSKKSNGFTDVGALPLPEGAAAGEISSLASLLSSANREAETKLTLSPFNYAANAYTEAGGDPTKLRLGSEAINFADALASERQRRELANKNDAEKQMFGVSNMNSGQPQLIDAIFMGPGTPEEKAARLQVQKDFARSSGGYSPEQKAVGDVYKDVLGFTTPVSPVEGSVAQRLSDMAVAAENAKAGFKSGTYDVNSKEGAQGLRMNQAGLGARQQLDEPFNQQIRVDEAKSKLDQQSKLAEIVAKAVADEEHFNVSTPIGAQQNDMRLAGMSAAERLAFAANEEIRTNQAKRDALVNSSPSPDTSDGALIYSMKRAGASDQQIAAALQKPVIIPEGGSAILPPGSYAQQALNPSVDKVALAKQAEDALTSMTKEELAALPREQLIRLKQAINAGKSAAPAPIQSSEIVGRFPTKEEAPKSGQLSYDPEKGILLSTKLEKVDPKVDHEFDKLLDAYDNVTRAIEATQKYPKAFGNQFAVAAKIPFFGESAKNSLIAKGETAARSIVFDATSEKKHEIYGAALTGGEQLDANNFLVSGADSAEKAREKMQSLQGNIYRVIERRMDTYQPYNQSNFLKSYESGRKMIDPASMTRAQQRNGKTPTPAAAPTQAPAPAPAPSPAVAPTPVPAPQRGREGPPNNSGFGVRG